MFEQLITTPSWTAPECPAPPDWRLDWPAVERRNGWLRRLAGVPQDPAYHAEGDVLVHTRLVVEALVGLPAWRALPPVERALLFMAALLHDIAKATCTHWEDGRIVSPGHARTGAMLTRALLWAGDGFDAPIPFACREAIARLVRHHGLPLWFVDKPDPRRAVIAASQSVRLDHAALLAEADVLGRVSPDRRQLLDRLALFRDFCAEQGCYDRPRAFASDHSRFVYFRSECGDPDYAAHDDTAFEVVLLSGLPGAGKDTWATEHCADRPVIALDAIRQELGITPRAGQNAIGQAARECARDLLRRRQPFVWNATNISRPLRASLIDLFAAYGARVRIVYLDAPLAVLLQRNRARAAAVPEPVIRKMLHKLDVPDLTEAHQVEWIGE